MLNIPAMTTNISLSMQDPNISSLLASAHLHRVCEGLRVDVVALLAHHVHAALTKGGHIHLVLALQSHSKPRDVTSSMQANHI